MNRVLLTGATGFLGSHLLEALLQQGQQVTILKRTTSNTWRINHLLPSVNSFDVDTQPLEQAFAGPPFQCVIHTACSYGRGGQPAHQVAESNLLFGLRLLDAAIAAQAQTFINTDTFFNTTDSSSKYLNAYTLSKKQFLEWLLSYTSLIRVINLKLHHIYGPKDDKSKFVPWLIEEFKKNPPRIPLTAGQQLRDFVYVEDVVAAFLVIVNKHQTLTSGSSFDVASGNVIRLIDFVQALFQEFKKIQPHTHTELGFGDIPINPGEIMTVHTDISKLVQLGWRPTSGGISKVIHDAVAHEREGL